MSFWKQVKEFLGRVRSADARGTRTDTEGSQLAKDFRDASGPANVYNRPGITSRYYDDDHHSDSG